MSKPIIALMYDFDKTLSPRNMQDYGFMEGIDIEPAKFWDECTKLTKKHKMDSILAYMYLMLKNAKGSMLFKRENFRKLGKSVKLFPGVRTWFERVNSYCENRGAKAEHYIISSGLKEIIEGTEIADEFKEIYAAEFLYDDNGLAVWPALTVNFTSKTQFFFRINKGVLDVTDQSGLNEFVPKEDRRIPFRNMIYFGDGDTDIPCMKLTKVNGGHSVVVYEGNDKEARRLLHENRVDYALKADYRKGGSLERTIFTVIDEIIATSKSVEIHEKHMKSL